MNFKKISKSEFESINSIAVLFYDVLHSRCFGVIEEKGICFRFGWQSDLLEPVIKEIDKNIFAIGIDLSFAVVDFTHNRILLNMNLFYNFHTVLCYGDYIIVCTELEVILISIFTYDTVRLIALPDFFDRLIIEDKKLKIVCVGKIVLEQTI